MTKLACVFFAALVVIFGFLDTVKTEESVEQEKAADSNEADRSAYAHASISLQPYGSAVQVNSMSTQQGLVQCYACVDCPKVLANTPVKWCPRSLNPSKQSCVTYAEQFQHLKKAWYIRGCASERGSCSDIRHAHSSNTDIVKLIFCSECEGNSCNGATRSINDWSMAILALLVTPLVAKATLS